MLALEAAVAVRVLHVGELDDALLAVLVENRRAAQHVGHRRAMRAGIIDHGAADRAWNAHGPFKARPATPRERVRQ